MTFFSTPFNLSITVKTVDQSCGKCIDLMGIERTVTIYCCYRNFYKYFRLSGLNFSQHQLGCNFRILPVLSSYTVGSIIWQLVLTEITLSDLNICRLYAQSTDRSRVGNKFCSEIESNWFIVLCG